MVVHKGRNDESRQRTVVALQLQPVAKQLEVDPALVLFEEAKQVQSGAAGLLVFVRKLYLAMP